MPEVELPTVESLDALEEMAAAPWPHPQPLAVRDSVPYLISCAREAIRLEAELSEAKAEAHALDIRRRESRQLLKRMVKYVREDRATTRGVNRLARLTDQVEDYLRRTEDPRDILRDTAPAKETP
jgi:hypothetical protein